MQEYQAVALIYGAEGHNPRGIALVSAQRRALQLN